MKKNLFKKSMSVFLSILMLMSAWVFVPGEHQLEAEAASTVSPNGYVLVFNGNQADERVTSNYIVLCSDGQAGNTSCGVFQYDHSAVTTADNAVITLNVVYSSHGSNIANSEVMVIPVDVNLYPDGAGVHKNTAKFNEIFKSGYANSSSGYNYETPKQDVLDYFGVTEADAVGTIDQPNTTSTSTVSFNVTNAVKEAKSKGKNPCFLFVMTNGFPYYSNKNIWSDIRIHTSTSLSVSSGAYGMPEVGLGNKLDGHIMTTLGSTITVRYPTNMYLDISEDLADVGYSINISCNGNNRMVVYPAVWGGQESDTNSNFENDKTNYDGSLLGQNAIINNFDKYGIQKTGNGFFANESVAPDGDYTTALVCDNASNYLSNGNNYALQGKPKNTGDYNYSLAWFKNNNKNPRLTYMGAGGNTHVNNTNYYTGDVNFTIHVYNKEPLNSIVQKSTQIYDLNKDYEEFISADSLSTFKSAKNSAANLLPNRETTDSEVKSTTSNLESSVKGLKFYASNNALKSSIEEAKSLINSSDYSKKYTLATRTALETAINNAENSNYYPNVPVYSISNLNDSSTWSCGAKAAADQNSIDALVNAINSAKASMAIQSYTVEWLDYDGTSLKTETVNYGETPSCADPARESTAEYNYSFTGWEPAITAVTADATYTAQYNSNIRTYTITWKNGDTVIKTEELPYGVIPSYTGDEPTKAETETHTYEFAGWGDIATVTGPATYTAQFKEIPKSYTIKFVNWDGSELQSGEVNHGEMPVYSGNVPVKAGNDQFIYTFSGWSSEIAVATEDTTYTAQFTEAVKTYTITWKDGDGNVLKTEELAYGETPVYTGVTPTKTATDQYTYTFYRWPDTVPVTADKTYMAQFYAYTNSYTVTWIKYDDTELDKATYDYGTIAANVELPANSAATYDAYGHTTYSWPTISDVKGNASYKEVGAQAPHDWKVTAETDAEGWKVTVEPSCYAQGTRERACSVCAYTESGTVDATGEHIYGNWTKFDAKNHKGFCTTSGCIATTTEAHSVAENSKPVRFDDNWHVYICEKCSESGAMLNGAFDTSAKEACYEAGITYAEIEGDKNNHSVICICGNTKTASHNWVEDELKRVEETCKQDGYKFYNCPDCGATKEETTIASHDMVAGKIVAPTCISNGYTVYTCSKCSETENRDITPATGNHVFTGDWTPSTENVTKHIRKCSSDEACIEYEVKSCFNKVTYAKITGDTNHHTVICECGREKTAAHTWSGWVADPENTTDENGQMKNTCTDCRYEWLSACEYKVKENIDSTCTEKGHTTYECEKCSNGYTVQKELAKHTWVDADCDTPKTCSVCNATEGEALGHDMEETSAKVEPKCEVAGKTAVYTCANGCGKTTGGEEIEALKHDMKETSAKVEPKCEIAGKTAVYTCANNCGKTEGGEEIPALNHDMKLTAEKVEPKCEVAGKEAVYTCANGCGKTTGGEAIPALKHNMQKTADEVAPKCEVAGKTAVYTCANNCGKTTGGEEIKALEHNMKETSAKVEPKCEVAGKEAVYTCANGCGKTEGGEEIPALNHDMKLTAEKVEPKCEVAGKEAVYTCANGCGKTEGGEEIKALEHDMQKTEDEVAPKCEEAGKTAVYTCANGCGKTEGGEEIPALNHEYGTWSTTTPATCAAEGEERRDCIRCDAFETNVIGKLPHTEKVEDYKAPTCTSTGSQGATVCSVCGEVLAEGTTIPMLDHEFGTSPVRVIPASCIRGKVSVYKCNFCDETKEVQDPANELAPHTVVAVETVEPTCDTVGYSKKVCSTCKAEVGFETIPALGHADKNGDGSCDGCNTEIGGSDNGQKACTCICHKEGALMKFIYKILSFFWKIIGIGKSCPCGAVHY